jgi:inorganic triphosphatase YgiF
MASSQGSHRGTMEIELKLLIDPADMPAFRRLALLEQFAMAQPATRRLKNTYYDTPERFLRAHGLELRVRRVGRVATQTLKAVGPAVQGGLHQRPEWETRVSSAQPELGLLTTLVGAGSAWEIALGNPGLTQRLVPIFGSEVRRTVWNLRLPQGAAVELALDQGELRHGDRRAPINEVELELKAGSAGALFDLALQLQEQVPLRIGGLSKSARGYALGEPVATPIAAKSKPVTLRRDLSVEEGFRAIVGNALEQMHGNEAVVAQGLDPEGIHQMRVGMRRLRLAFRLFDPWIPQPSLLLQEVAWLGAVLGAARDADVLAESTLPRLIDACPQEEGLLPLGQWASSLAAAKRQDAAAAVASVRYARLMLGLFSWLEASRWREWPEAGGLAGLAEPLDKRAAQILHRTHRKLLKSGKRLAQATTEERHEVRIAAKKARYATEFFQALYATGYFKRYLRLLADLQDAFGWMNDAAVAEGLLREIERAHPELAGGAAFGRGYLCAVASRDLPGLGRLWKRFSVEEPN